MKKVFIKISILVSVLSILLLCGCSNLSGNNNGSSTVKITLTTEDVSSRSAIPSYPGNNIMWSLKVTVPGQDAPIEGSLFKDDDQPLYNNVFVFENLNPGKYLFTASGSAGDKQICQGSKEITVTGNTKYSETIVAQYINDNAQQGSLDLKINADESIVKSIEMECSGTTYNFTNQSGSNIFTLQNVQLNSGDYDAIFKVYGAKPNDDETAPLLCTIKQKICIRANVTTNTWVNTGEVFLQKDEKTDEVKFVLNKKIINSYTDSQVYVSSGVTLTAGNDVTGNGSWNKPFASLRNAINKINQINDGTTLYTIWIDGTIDSGNNQEYNAYLIYIETVDFPLNLSIKGLNTKSATKDKIIGINNGFVYVVNDQNGNYKSVELNFSDLCISDCHMNAILLNDKTTDVSIENCSFEGNWSTTGENAPGGAAICYKGKGNVTLNNCSFKENYITNSSDKAEGGAIYVSEKATLNATNCTFTNNSIQSNYNNFGGAVYLADSSSAKFDSCSFDGNYIKSDATTSSFINVGGAIYYSGNGNFELEKCTFNSNYINSQVQAYGGALRTGAVYDGNYVKINNCTFTGNHIKGTQEKGGAYYVESDTQLTSTKITGNYCENGNNGHGIFIENGSNSYLRIGGEVIIYDNYKPGTDSKTQRNLVNVQADISILSSPALKSTSKIGYSFIIGENYKYLFEPTKESPVSHAITSGFKQTGLNPSDVFISDDGYLMAWDSTNTEVVAAATYSSIEIEKPDLSFILNKSGITIKENSSDEYRTISVTPKTSTTAVPLNQITNKSIKMKQNGQEITSLSYFTVSSDNFTVVFNQNCPPGNYQMEISGVYKGQKYITTTAVMYNYDVSVSASSISEIKNYLNSFTNVTIKLTDDMTAASSSDYEETSIGNQYLITEGGKTYNNSQGQITSVDMYTMFTINSGKKHIFGIDEKLKLSPGYESTRVFTISGNNTEVTLENIDFSSLNTDSTKGSRAIYIIDGAKVTLKNCILNNYKYNHLQNEYYGIIYVADGELNIENCIFSNNKDGTGTYNYAVGAGIFGTNNSKIIIRDSVFSNNSGHWNSAALCSDGELYIYHTEFSNNTSPRGAAVQCYGPKLYIDENCTFKSNSAEIGSWINNCAGAIYTKAEENIIRNSVFSQNNVYSSSYGGDPHLKGGSAILIDGTSCIIDNCTFTDNTSSKLGGAIVVYSNSTNPSPNITFTGTITESGNTSNGSTTGTGSFLYVYGEKEIIVNGHTLSTATGFNSYNEVLALN